MGCVQYVLSYFSTARTNFQRAKTAGEREPDLGALFKLTEHHAPNIKQHGETALQLLQSLFSTRQYRVLEAVAFESQQRLGMYRRVHNLDCAPAAFAWFLFSARKETTVSERKR